MIYILSGGTIFLRNAKLKLFNFFIIILSSFCISDGLSGNQSLFQPQGGTATACMLYVAMY